MHRIFTPSIVAVALMICPTACLAQVSFALLDIGPSGQRVESGAIGVGTAAHNSNDIASSSFSGLVADTGNVFDLTITNNNVAGLSSGDGIDWRDRGDSTSTGSLIHLGEDFIKNNAGFIELTFSGLPAGTYTATSYHRDPGFAQSDDIHVFITDALGTDVDAGQVGDAGTNVALNSLSTANVASSSVMDFAFVSDGINPVVLVFDGTGSGDNETPLNGLALQFLAVPEPASIAIWTLLGIAMFGFGYRKFQRGQK